MLACVRQARVEGVDVKGVGWNIACDDRPQEEMDVVKVPHEPRDVGEVCQFRIARGTVFEIQDPYRRSPRPQVDVVPSEIQRRDPSATVKQDTPRCAFDCTVDHPIRESDAAVLAYVCSCSGEDLEEWLAPSVDACLSENRPGGSVDHEDVFVRHKANLSTQQRPQNHIISLDVAGSCRQVQRSLHTRAICIISCRDSTA